MSASIYLTDQDDSGILDSWNRKDELSEAVIYFKEYENCLKFMTELRWNNGRVACPRCGSEHVTYLEKARVWKCYGKDESPKFPLKDWDYFEDSPLGLDK